MKNNFRHQTYSDDRPSARFELLEAEFPSQPGSAAFAEIAKRFDQSIHGHVDSVFLVHGSFVGDDSLGWTAQISKRFPNVGSQITMLGKRLVDLVSGESGNFTDDFRKLLEDSLTQQQKNIAVRKFVWSSENTHSGRARAAIELLHELIETGKQKFLFLCHSHGGNVLALVTNLLGAEPQKRNKFLSIVRSLFHGADKAIYEKVSRYLATDAAKEIALHIVTMGTPVRYGWEQSGYHNLLHVVNHRRHEDVAEYLAPPLNLNGLKSIKGDVIQQAGIASTNFFPFLLDKQLMETERNLGAMIQAGIERKTVLDRLRLGTRVHDAGTTLLVDYDNYEGLARLMAGHAIYTRPEWLAFHLDQIRERMFPKTD